ncbi:MAG: SPW repeat protein [Kutzneria sp.]|nr:SPW repeat protein [Kutzneria sp.]
MAGIPRSVVDLDSYPDVSEMRERYARVLDGPSASVVDGLVLLAGLYTTISPWVVRFDAVHPCLTIDNLIIGIAVAVLGYGLAAVPARSYRMSWAMVVLGV